MKINKISSVTFEIKKVQIISLKNYFPIKMILNPLSAKWRACTTWKYVRTGLKAKLQVSEIEKW